jgi:release factor glutamine methyltransferase
MTSTINDMVREAARRLAAAGIDSARLDAEVLMGHALGVDRTHLFLQLPEAIPDSAATTFLRLVDQRLGGAPVAYLTGTREFMGLPFRVGPGVLIPRPDTEPLVEWALAWLEHRPDARVADIGTGSGAIAISIAALAPAAFAGEVIAVDISAAALAIARENASALLNDDRRRRFHLREGSLAAPLDAPVDLLLANLPYLTPGQIAENPALDAEPRLALDGGPDGLDLIRILAADLPRILASGGAAGFEIDPSQEAAVRDVLTHALPGCTIGSVRDLAHTTRHVVATTHA